MTRIANPHVGRRARLPMVAAVALTLGSFAVVNGHHVAHAQNATIGNTDQVVADVLARNGYTDARVTRRGLTIIRTEACREGKKYQVKVSILGRITSTQEIGRCAVVQNAQQNRPAFNARRAIRRLESRGFTDVTATNVANGVVARGCNGGRYVEFNFDPAGQPTSRRQAGQCTNGRVATQQQQREPQPQQQAGPTENELRRALRRQGYSRIQITDAQLPGLTAEACSNNERLRLTMNRRGNVRRERVIGDCRNAIRAADIPSQLQKAGYDRVRLLRDNRAPYLAEACKGRDLMELTINRFGETRKEERVGRCAVAVTKQQVIDKLKTGNYTNISVEKNDRGWAGTFCKGTQKFVRQVDPYNELISDRVVGQCKVYTVLEVLQTLEKRGAKNTSFAVTGCFKNNEYRWSFDRLGNRTGRERTGRSCR
ncbi:MAG: hypothetical protein AAFO61_11825 [Pseudomonadota bacterium]